MAKLKLHRIVALLGLSVLCVGSILKTDIMISPCKAMQAPKSVTIDFQDFMNYVQANIQDQAYLNTAKGQIQQQAIYEVFVLYGNTISEQNKENFFSAVDQLVMRKKILKKQASAIKDYVNKKLTDQLAFPAQQPAPIIRSVKPTVKPAVTPAITPTVTPAAPQKMDDFTAWTATIAHLVNKYFKLPYTDKLYLSSKKGRDSLQCPDGTFVHRPNHGLAHGVRQGLYAVDIVEGLNSPTLQFSSKTGRDIQRWVKQKMANDPHFKEKVEFASAFQRTGRKSEKDGGPVYEGYVQIDVENFKKEVVPYSGPGGMFEHDVDIFAEALSLDDSTTMDALYLYKIFRLSHLLDLRRLTYKGKGTWQENHCDKFFDDDCGANERQFIDILWGRAGEYLRASGDRDRDPSVKTHRNRNPKVFCALAKDPTLLAQTLITTRQNSSYHF